MSSPLQNNITNLQNLLDKVNALPEEATPVISVNNSNGLITATAGTKSATHQLAFQAAKTITPSTTSQTAVSSGYYTGGNITVAGDSDLVAENIKSGVNIFGVTGTYAGSGGGTSMEDGLITGTLASYTNDRVTKIGDYAFYSNSIITSVSFANATSIGLKAFYYCKNIKSVNFPNVTHIGDDAFGSCSKLTSVNFPSATNVNDYAFRNCSILSSVNIPKIKYIGMYAFSSCSKLYSVSFPLLSEVRTYAFYNCLSLQTVRLSSVTNIGGNAFDHCVRLTSLYLTGSSVCYLVYSNAFTSTPIGGYSTSAGTYGSIYVPASLLASYKTATNWTYFSSRFVGI